MEPIWEWGLEFIRAVQSVHGPMLDAFFTAITFMGEEVFFLFLLPLILWCIDYAIGARMGLVFLLSTYANIGLKDLFAQPRPFRLDPAVKRYETWGYGLPSGHAQSSVVVWGILAAEFRKRWVWVAAVLLMILIGFSRIYLGVHFPTDVLGGWLVGAFFLAGYVALQPRVETWLEEAGLAVQLALAVAIPLILLLFHPTADIAIPLGVLMGTGVGVVFTSRFFPFSAQGPWWQCALRFLVGAVVLSAIYWGLRLILPGEGEPLYLPLRFVRYGAVGLWVGAGGPWLFHRLGLTSEG